jgi:glycosyltransferase involved in cell wall biosynthesis
MTMMARGLPIFAFVRPDSEVERIIRSSGGGWVVSCGGPERLPLALRDALGDPEELARRGRAAAFFAGREFTVERLTQRFEELITELTAEGST